MLECGFAEHRINTACCHDEVMCLFIGARGGIGVGRGVPRLGSPFFERHGKIVVTVHQCIRVVAASGLPDSATHDKQGVLCVGVCLLLLFSCCWCMAGEREETEAVGVGHIHAVFFGGGGFVYG